MVTYVNPGSLFLFFIRLFLLFVPAVGLERDLCVKFSYLGSGW